MKKHLNLLCKLWKCADRLQKGMQRCLRLLTPAICVTALRTMSKDLQALRIWRLARTRIMLNTSKWAPANTFPAAPLHGFIRTKRATGTARKASRRNRLSSHRLPTMCRSLCPSSKAFFKDKRPGFRSLFLLWRFVPKNCVIVALKVRKHTHQTITGKQAHLRKGFIYGYQK